ncbi:MAG: ATP-binding cassette domain-containing protein [Chloroflexaceae bacterium]|nr:ATP-binding cassette domain-containing protein [Chloroflexaceae bacterium]NJO07311.1 ATP-binding cassette domain-containing protein [Chloroflexaceae bacterium]
MWKRLFGGGDKTGGNGAYRYGNEHLIELRRIVKTYETAAGSFTVLKGVDVQIDRGEFVAVIGKSGSGKSTLVNMITGIDRPSSGEVLVGDTAVHKLSEGQMAVWRGKNLGIIFQFFQLLPTLTIIENVMLPMDFCNMYTPSERRKRAMMLLEQVEMTENAHKLPSAVSGGQAQRVAIARALANDPPILVADEPTGSLDSKTANAVFAVFEKMIQEGKTIVMVTHDNDLARRATRAIIVVDGVVTNQYVTRALPHLGVDEMTRIARQMNRETYEAGATIVNQGDMADRFYIITRGAVDIFLPHPDGQEIHVDRLEAGQYFGEIGLLERGTRTATVRAYSDSDVEVATLDREAFTTLLQDSDLTRDVLDRTRRERIERDESNLGRPTENMSNA